MCFFQHKNRFPDVEYSFLPQQRSETLTLQMKTRGNQTNPASLIFPLDNKLNVIDKFKFDNKKLRFSNLLPEDA